MFSAKVTGFKWMYIIIKNNCLLINAALNVMRYLLKTRILHSTEHNGCSHAHKAKHNCCCSNFQSNTVPFVIAETHPYLLFKTSNHNMPFEEIIKLIKIGSTTVVKTNTTIKLLNCPWEDLYFFVLLFSFFPFKWHRCCCPWYGRTLLRDEEAIQLTLYQWTILQLCA